MSRSGPLMEKGHRGAGECSGMGTGLEQLEKGMENPGGAQPGEKGNPGGILGFSRRGFGV